MGAMTGVAVAAALLLPGAVSAETVADWRPFVVEASKRFGVPVPWIERVMRAESGGRTMLNGVPIVSRAGAMGLMQLMPATWAAMRVRFALGRDPFDPRDNIAAGTAFLRLMYDRFGYPGLFAAYNAGPGRYAVSLAGRSPLPVETTRYLAAVTDPAATTPMMSDPAQSRLFAMVTNGGSASEDEARSAPPAGLFAYRARP